MESDHEDVVHLLQAESVIKKVPDHLDEVRRIIQYAKDSKDQGSDFDMGLGTPITIVILAFAIAVMYMSLFMNASVSFRWKKPQQAKGGSATSATSATDPENQPLITNDVALTVKGDQQRKYIVDKIREKLDL